MYRQFSLMHSSMSRVVLSLSRREDALEQSLHHEHLLFPHLPQLLATMRGEREQMLHSLHTYQFGQSSSPLSVTLFLLREWVPSTRALDQTRLPYVRQFWLMV